jgi:uncharacterized membrane protein required for colicin V production
VLQDLGSRINWVDILCLILLLRATYIGYRVGLSVEIFKFLGILSALIFSISGYSFIAGYLSGYIPQEVADVASFIAIVLATVFVFSIIRRFLSFLIKLQPIVWLEKGGGLILGLARGVVTISLVLIMLTLTQSIYLNTSIKNESFSGSYFLKAGSEVYTFLTRKFPNLNNDSEVQD